MKMEDDLIFFLKNKNDDLKKRKEDDLTKQKMEHDLKRTKKMTSKKIMEDNLKN